MLVQVNRWSTARFELHPAKACGAVRAPAAGWTARPGDEGASRARKSSAAKTSRSSFRWVGESPVLEILADDEPRSRAAGLMTGSAELTTTEGVRSRQDAPVSG